MVWLALKEYDLFKVGALEVVDDSDVATVMFDDDTLANEGTEDAELDLLTRVLVIDLVLLGINLGEAFGVDFPN
jgi:hypothetical protein